jgi:lysozyme
MRDISSGLNLIASCEGFDEHPYLDAVGIPTIGFGTTVYPDGRKVTMNDSPITKEFALECLKFHVKTECLLLEKFLLVNKIKLNDKQFSALVCFAYNCGLGPIINDGKMLNMALKRSGFKGIEDAFLAYTKGTLHGQRVELKGLVKRRKAEIALFLS